MSVRSLTPIRLAKDFCETRNRAAEKLTRRGSSPTFAISSSASGSPIALSRSLVAAALRSADLRAAVTALAGQICCSALAIWARLSADVADVGGNRGVYVVVPAWRSCLPFLIVPTAVPPAVVMRFHQRNLRDCMGLSSSIDQSISTIFRY